MQHLSRLFVLSAAFLFLVPGAQAQPVDTTDVEDPALRLDLLEMAETDQELRMAYIEKGMEKLDSLEIQRLRELDATHLERLMEIVERHGWPTSELVGPDGVKAAFLIVQHSDADPSFQRDMLPFIEKDAEAGVLSGQEVAMLTDRVLTNEGKPQRYGTQVSIIDGEAVVMPMEDPDSVDVMRSRLGLQPLDEYLRQLKQFYGLDQD